MLRTGNGLLTTGLDEVAIRTALDSPLVADVAVVALGYDMNDMLEIACIELIEVMSMLVDPDVLAEVFEGEYKLDGLAAVTKVL